MALSPTDANFDPLLSLALAMRGTPGAYALLLGSGVSRAAGIPTGWEVVLDLIRNVAVAQGEEPEPSPEAWFRATFGVDANYSDLLQALAPSATERAQLLKAYFEPSDEEREQGLKQPTNAHRAIAKLVASGDVRVILTTNFDHLIENAIRDEGVEPQVWSTPDAIRGGLPLSHAPCTIIKLHGDYLDSRSLNTLEELSSYDPATDKLLDRVLDEYGMIVCGWSGAWDAALRAAIERCPNRRFTTYWSTRGTVADAAKALIELRRAVLVDGFDADAFFARLNEQLQSLRDRATPHPSSVAVKVATLKRYLADPTAQIRLDDLVEREVQATASRIAHVPDQIEGGDWSESVPAKAAAYEATVVGLAAMGAVGCRWGDGSRHTNLWCKALEATSRAGRSPTGGSEPWLGMRNYPTLLLFYAAGIGAMVGQKGRVLADLLERPLVRVWPDSSRPTFHALHPYRVFNNQSSTKLPGMEQHRTPVSDYLFEVLREPLRECVRDDDEYERAFDSWEWLRAVHAFWRVGDLLDGRFLWKYRDISSGRFSPIDHLGSEVERGALAGLVEGLKLNGPQELIAQLNGAAAAAAERSRTFW